MLKNFITRLSYNLIVSLLVALLMSEMLTVVLLVGGENVTMKSRSIVSGITTGTIGTTAMKGRYIHNLVVRLLVQVQYQGTYTSRQLKL